jgi:hypothetical protein
LGIGDLGMGDWGLGIGPNPQSPIPNPQSPIPNPQLIKYLLDYKIEKYLFKIITKKNKIKIKKIYLNITKNKRIILVSPNKIKK